ncbi:MAG: fimbrillin family protein [Bacteroides sp.]|nr:fimbrillin family protein [Bacteroides sp.]
MKRHNLFNLLFGGLLFAGAFLSSCSENDLKEENISGVRMLTFDVGSGFDESADEQGRSLPEKNDTIYQDLGNGMKIEAVIEEDKTGNSRGYEQVSSGVAVLAIVYNIATNRVHSVQNLMVNSGRLTCMVPDDRNVKIVFYSYNTATAPTTSLVENDLITTFDAANSAVLFGKDVMRAESIEVTPLTTSLGTVIFKHMFPKIRTVMTANKKFTHFIVMIDDGSARRHAAINVVLGTVTPDEDPVGVLMHGYGTGSTTVTSDFEFFIPVDTESHLLSFTQVDHTAVYVPSIPLNKRFESGHSYTLKVTLKK